MTTNQTFTAADVAALAELIRPHLSEDWDLEAAVALAEAREREAFERRIGRTSTMAAYAAPVFQERFRAEAVA